MRADLMHATEELHMRTTSVVRLVGDNIARCLLRAVPIVKVGVLTEHD